MVINWYTISWFHIMVPFINLVWITFFTCCICIFFAKDISSVKLKRRGRKTNSESDDKIETMNTKSIAGFALTKDDMEKFHLWPSGIIPYYIDDFSFDKVLRDRIRIYLENVNTITGLQFLEIARPPEDDSSRWVMFLNRKGMLGCADHSFKNFTNEGVQRVVLGYNCLNTDEDLASIILSLVGVPPQHNSPDRDKYLTVMNENIIPDKLHLFEKLKDNEWLFYDLGHDFLSAGHYSTFKHTLNGRATLVAKDPQPPSHTQSVKEKGFSYSDILKIKMLYNYISRNRKYPLKAPECSKLFNPSSKLSSVQTLSEDNVSPRPKPSRYLGQLDSIQESDKEDNVPEENDNEMTDTSDKKLIDIREDSNGEREIDERNVTNHVDTENIIDKESDYDEIVNNKNHTKDNEIETQKPSLEVQEQEIESVSNEINEISKNVTEIVKNSSEIVNNEGNFKERIRLAHKMNYKTLKLLGQSDYETGDEGNKKYIHERTI